MVLRVARRRRGLGLRPAPTTARRARDRPADHAEADAGASCDTCAYGFNPLRRTRRTKRRTPALAIDGDPSTYWQTQDYYDGRSRLRRPASGLYLDAKPSTTARKILIDTQTPGWNAQIYATDATPVFAPHGAPSSSGGPWTLVGSASNVKSRQTITLNSGCKQYRYWLVWITSLGGHQQIDLNEVALYR